MRPGIRDAVVAVGNLFFLVNCAAAAPVPALEKDDLFAPYAKGVPKVTAVISEETKDGVKVTKLRFASAEIEPAFFAHVLAGGNPPLPEPNAVAVPRDGKVLKFTVKNCPDRAAGWFYVNWLPDQPRGWDARDWARLEAVPGSNGEFTCAIPESLGAFDWFGGITFTLKAGTFAQPMSLSTKIYRCGEGPAKLAKSIPRGSNRNEHQP